MLYYYLFTVLVALVFYALLLLFKKKVPGISTRLCFYTVLWALILSFSLPGMLSIFAPGTALLFLFVLFLLGGLLIINRVSVSNNQQGETLAQGSNGSIAEETGAQVSIAEVTQEQLPQPEDQAELDMLRQTREAEEKAAREAAEKAAKEAEEKAAREAAEKAAKEAEEKAAREAAEKAAREAAEKAAKEAEEKAAREAAEKAAKEAEEKAAREAAEKAAREAEEKAAREAAEKAAREAEEKAAREAEEKAAKEAEEKAAREAAEKAAREAEEKAAREAAEKAAREAEEKTAAFFEKFLVPQGSDQSEPEKGVFLLQQQDLPYNELFESAFQAREEGNYELAIERLRSSLDGITDISLKGLIYTELVFLYKEMGKYLEAAGMIQGFVAENGATLAPSLVRQFTSLVNYLQTVDQLLKKADQAEMPYSQVPRLIKLRAEKVLKE